MLPQPYSPEQSRPPAVDRSTFDQSAGQLLRFVAETGTTAEAALRAIRLEDHSTAEAFLCCIVRRSNQALGLPTPEGYRRCRRCLSDSRETATHCRNCGGTL